VSLDAVPTLTQLAVDDPGAGVRKKCILALSSAVRNCQPALDQLLKGLPENLKTSGNLVATGVEGVSPETPGNLDATDMEGINLLIQSLRHASAKNEACTNILEHS
jgi:hsp70-interacting protein